MRRNLFLWQKIVDKKQVTSHGQKENGFEIKSDPRALTAFAGDEVISATLYLYLINFIFGFSPRVAFS